MTQALQKLDAAARMLAEVRTVEDAVQVADIAAAAEVWAKRARLGLEAQNHAAEIKVRAERKAGELLTPDSVSREQGARTDLTSCTDAQSEYAATLQRAGITRFDAVRWQKLATFDDARFDSIIAGCKERREEITTAFLLRAWRREQKTKMPSVERSTRSVESLEQLIVEGFEFGTVYADPPWQYQNSATRGAQGDHYRGMSVDEIAALPVAQLAAPNAHLHLWTTNGFLFDAPRIIDAWGFTYKSCFVWVKPQIGMGNYWRVSHEYCLFATRGRAPFGSRSERSWQEWRRGKHSAKPERMYDIIERVSPAAYLELFARSGRAGWTSWGNEVENDLLTQEAS